MDINGIGFGYPAWRGTGKTQKNSPGKEFAIRFADAVGVNVSESTKKVDAADADKAPFDDLRESGKRAAEEGYKEPDSAGRESGTRSDIIVKPDGSRVLVVTVNIGGMETTMSLEISKPTDIVNEAADREETDDGQPAIRDGNPGADQMTDAAV